MLCFSVGIAVVFNLPAWLMLCLSCTSIGIDVVLCHQHGQWWWCLPTLKVKVKVWFYIALYPVRWTAQSALHFPPLADLFIPTPFSASLGSILAMQQLRNDYSITFPPLSIARYSFIQLSRLRRREVKENAQTSKR